MAFKSKLEEKVMDVDASMQGSLSFKDPVNLRINGKFEGTLEVRGNLTIGQNAIVLADIVEHRTMAFQYCAFSDV